MAEKPYVPEEEETESEAAESSGDVADSDLIAAAEAALKGVESPAPKPKAPGEKDEGGEPERDGQGRFLPKSEKPKTKEAPEKPSNVIARELARREAARAERTQYEGKVAEAEKAIAQAQTLLQQVQARASELEEEKRAFAAARRDPAAFLAQQGWTADQFIDSATRAKDPIYQETVTLREELSKRDHVINELRDSVQQLVAKARTYDEQGERAQKQAEVREFFSSIPKDSPLWQDYDDEGDLLYFAKKTRQKYYEATGKVASPQQLGEYLHYKALSKRGVSSQESREQKSIAGKPKAKVPRALGGSESSERRGGNGQKHIHDMTPEEETAFLVDVATAAVTGE